MGLDGLTVTVNTYMPPALSGSITRPVVYGPAVLSSKLKRSVEPCRIHDLDTVTTLFTVGSSVAVPCRVTIVPAMAVPVIACVLLSKQVVRVGGSTVCERGIAIVIAQLVQSFLLANACMAVVDVLQLRS